MPDRNKFRNTHNSMPGGALREAPKHVAQQTKHNKPDPSVTKGTTPLGGRVPHVLRSDRGRSTAKTHVCDARCLLTPEQVQELEASKHRQLAELAAWKEQA